MINIVRRKSLENINKSSSMSEILEKNSKNFGERIFLIDHTSKKQMNISYAKFNEYVNYCCIYFKQLNLVKGDIITLILDNSVAYLILYFSSIRYGTILNPLPVTLGKSIIEEKLIDVNPKIIFTNLSHSLKGFNNRIHKVETDDFKKFISFLKKKKIKSNNSL